MTTREGSLEAPTRHPLDWHNPEFYDHAALEKELERVYDICHGCRRCVSLCGSFPTLFDLIDESKTGEVDGVAKADYGKVVDQCYLCDVCYMTKCPYVPPHPWNVDFPHLMLRAKAVKFRDGDVKFRDKLLTGTDRLGKLATIPVVVQIVNKANTMPSARKVMQAMLGVDAGAKLPPYAKDPLRSHVEPSVAWPVRDGERTPGKVAVFATCYVNYNEPGIGHDLLKLLAHNEIPYRFAEKEACCGMPKLELGDLESVEKLKNVNIPQLVALARDGYAIVTPVPSCTLMYKQELPLLFPDDPDVRARRRRDVRPVRILRRARQGRPAEEGLHAAAGQGQLPHPLPFARAERRAEDPRGAAVGAGHRGEHRRALRWPRRHVGDQGGVLRAVDEDRQAGLRAHERERSRLRVVRLPDGGHAGSCRASTRKAARRARARSIR